jgi:sialic acid synthase SpsE
MYGSDQAASIETNALRDFVNTVRAIPAILGTGEKVMSEAEMKTREKLRISVSG